MELKQEQLKSIIESIFFIANRPLTIKDLSKIIGQKTENIQESLSELMSDYQKQEKKGLKIIQNNKEYQMVTNPDYSQFIQKFLKQEVNQELTPASLETLSIIAYRGPIRRDELEQIRGVNCSIILRNLLIKGLIIEENKDNETYNVSLDFIRHLGIKDLNELPDYQKLNQDISLSSLIGEEE